MASGLFQHSIPVDAELFRLFKFMASSYNAMSEDYQMIMRRANSGFEQLLNAVNTVCLQLCSGSSWLEAHTHLLPLRWSQEAPTDTRSASALGSAQVYVAGADQPTSILLYSE